MNRGLQNKGALGFSFSTRLLSSVREARVELLPQYLAGFSSRGQHLADILLNSLLAHEFILPDFLRGAMSFIQIFSGRLVRWRPCFDDCLNSCQDYAS